VRSQLFIVMLMSILGFGFAEDTNIWKKISTGLYENDIRSIFINPKDDHLIYVGTSKALYKSNDQGQNYQAILRPSGEQKEINDIYISLDQPEVIYAATGSGLYESSDGGKSWDRIYYSSKSESRHCLSVIRHGNTIYLGTRGGLFQKADHETSWRNVKEKVGNKPVYRMVQDEQFIYLATGQTLYRLDKKAKRAETIFSLGIGEGRGEDSLLIQDLELGKERYIKFIEISPGPAPLLFVASSKGVYISSTRGAQWDRLPISNLALEHMTSLVVLENNIQNEKNCHEEPQGCFEVLVGTSKGVFFLKHEKWMPLYRGMETNEISYLAKDAVGTVYAATGKGIYSSSHKEALPLFPISLKTQTSTWGRLGFDHEPTINEVHALAIDYAEVNQSKIADWRVLARKKALLPDLSVGLDRNASDLFHWNTGANPDELQKGRDYIDWDVSLSWDLADFVWSTDQTTIDSRSKLMVELREDILDEVTRLYFERRRLQNELVSYNAWEPQIKLDKDLRIAELTALIDALTGGEFSKRIHQ